MYHIFFLGEKIFVPIIQRYSAINTKKGNRLQLQGNPVKIYHVTAEPRNKIVKELIHILSLLPSVSNVKFYACNIDDKLMKTIEKALEAHHLVEHIMLKENQLTIFPRLEKMVGLLSLGVQNNYIPKIEIAANHLVHLKELNLRRNQITHITNLDDLIQLEKLDLRNNKITTFTGLSTLINLKELRLYRNKITKITGLSALTNLNLLDISVNKITTIEGLDTLIHLNYLFLSNNYITTVNRLATLTNLKVLHIGHNYITSVDSLGNLKQLVTLYLANNRISNVDGLFGLTKLENLNLWNNTIRIAKNTPAILSLQEDLGIKVDFAQLTVDDYYDKLWDLFE